ncbi:MAG: hypothetical protein GXZ06_09730 [Tissierellia bacterium]|nr:hypothetical protein [Tissierellia bacterium]
MNSVWNEIDSLLRNIEFNKLWKGFKRYKFALYDDEKAYFGDKEITVDNRFIGNTAIDYDGEKLAIWKVSKEELENLQVLAANIVHEMFHAFQIENQEKRFPNDIKGLNKPFDVEYYNMKSREAKLLAEAISSDDYSVRLSNLVEIISLRELRSKQYKDVTDYEFGIETIEGAAEYVSMKALNKINKNEYEKRINSYLQNIIDNNMLFDTRRYSYFFGSMLLLLLDSLNIELSQDIRDNPITVMEEVMSKIDKRVNIEFLPKDPIIEENLDKYYRELYNRFRNLHNSSNKSHPGCYSINGYDSMNMYKLGNEVLHEHFVILYDHDKDKSLFIKGPVITVFNQDESQVIDYITAQ